MKSTRLPYLLLIPTMAILLLFTVYPLGYSIFLSLHSWDLGAPKEMMKWVGFSNFSRAFTDINFWMSLKNTLIFVVFAVLGEFVLGFSLALLVVKRKNNPFARLITVIRPLILLPMIVTPVVVGLMWRLLYNYELGMVNYFLGFFGIGPQSWLTNLKIVLPVVILTDIWEWTPFMFLIFMSGLSALPAAPLESAKVDGASFFQVIRHITLPLLSPLILVAVMIRGIDVIRIFDLVYVMTAGGPGNATETMSLFGYREAFMKSSLGYGSAVALILTIFVTAAGMFAVRRMYQEVE